MLRLSAPFRSTFYLLSFYFRRIIFQRFPVPCFVSCTSPFALHFSALCRLTPCLCTLPFVLYLSCFASPALSVDTGFFITSSLALHLSRFILCAVSFGALSLHFAFRALPPLRYRSTPDSSSLRLLHFTFRASFLCAVSFGALSLTFRLSVSYFPYCAARRALSEPPVSKHHCFRCHASTMPPL